MSLGANTYKKFGQSKLPNYLLIKWVKYKKQEDAWRRLRGMNWFK